MKLIIKILNLMKSYFDIGSISNYKNIFAKGYVPNWSEQAFVIKSVKKLLSGHM